MGVDPLTIGLDNGRRHRRFSRAVSGRCRVRRRSASGGWTFWSYPPLRSLSALLSMPLSWLCQQGARPFQGRPLGGFLSRLGACPAGIFRSAYGC